MAAADVQGSTELVIGTADMIKLAVPFVTAILLVWIKGWIEERAARGRKQRALWRLVVNELGSVDDTLQSFRRIAASAQRGRIHLVTLATPALLAKLSNDLADLDAKNAYAYADVDGWVSIVNAGLARLATLQMARVQAVDEAADKLDRVIFGQARISASDAVSLSAAAIAALRRIPTRQRESEEPEALLASLTAQVEAARRALDGWPRFGDPAEGMAASPPVAAATSNATPTPPPPVPLLPRTHPDDDAWLDAGG